MLLICNFLYSAFWSISFYNCSKTINFGGNCLLLNKSVTSAREDTFTRRDTFARWIFFTALYWYICTSTFLHVYFCKQWHFCNTSHYHTATFLHGRSFLNSAKCIRAKYRHAILMLYKSEALYKRSPWKSVPSCKRYPACESDNIIISVHPSYYTKLLS